MQRATTTTTTTAFATASGLSTTSLLPGPAKLAASPASFPVASPSAATTSMTLSRRAAIGLGFGALGAALLGNTLPAAAKSGDSPKISVFGVGAMSAPFEAGIKKSGNVLYQRFSDEELNFLKGIVDGSVERLAAAKPSIDGKSWEDVRSALRLEMSELRSAAKSLNESISDPKKSALAGKLFAQLKQDVNDLDYACVIKNQERALKLHKAATKSLDTWREAAGI